MILCSIYFHKYVLEFYVILEPACLCCDCVYTSQAGVKLLDD